MSAVAPLSLFTAFGVELEYMIVDASTLDVRPIADELLRAAAGQIVSETDQGGVSWSNELVLHVVELKTTEPAASLAGRAESFAAHVARIGELLRPHGARLMPTAMHPWMDPRREMRLWPHDYGEVYAAFDRIFGCQGHGWANLQSVHLNLPFADDAEFGRLHAAVRLVLPILPALAASSPFMDRAATGLLDSRLNVYRHNSARIPSITGSVVPEAVFTRADYQAQILDPIYRDIASYDPDETLRDEWLNARGAIARFGRQTIEIRVLDVQECPRADLAICRAAVAVLRALVAERWTPLERQQAWPVEPLAEILQRTTRDAERAVIENRDYLAAFGLTHRASCTAGELWSRLIDSLPELAAPPVAEWREPLDVILREGPLARRILAATGPAPDDARLAEVYRRLCDCLAWNEMFCAV